MQQLLTRTIIKIVKQIFYVLILSAFVGSIKATNHTLTVCCILRICQT